MRIHNTARRRTLVLLVSCFLLASMSRGSGSGYFRVWFFDPTRPSAPIDQFLDGELGILELDDLRADYRLLVFRLLSGPGMNERSRRAFETIWTNQTRPTEDGWRSWRKVLESQGTKVGFYFPNRRSVVLDREGTTSYVYFDNCHDDAFHKATETWSSRQASYDDRGHLDGWLNAQQTVFANCGSKDHQVPEALPSSSPRLAQKDRNYQIAAAHFYAMEYALAERLFLEIDADPTSPWSQWGAYLGARSAIRQSTISAGGLQPLRRAERLLESILTREDLALQHARSERLLNFVRFRLEPEEQRQRLAKLLLETSPAEGRAQQLTDFLRSKGPCGGVTETTTPTSPGSADVLLEWTACLNSPPPSARALAYEVVKWRAAARAHRPLWLLSLATHATGGEPATAEILKALAAVDEDHALAASASFHRARILIGQGRRDEAREILDRELVTPRRTKRRSDENRLRLLRAQTARTLDEMVADSVQIPVANAYTDGIGAPPSTPYSSEELETPLLIGPAAMILNRASPRRLLELTEATTSLPGPQGTSLLLRSWLLAVLQGDEQAALDAVPSLSRAAPDLAERLAAWRDEAEDRNFAAALVLLENRSIPLIIQSGDYGLKDGGRGWCAGLVGSDQSLVPLLNDFVPSQEAESLRGAQELLAETPHSYRWLADAVLEHADQVPEDPEVPRALHLIVQASRKSWCRNGDISKEAFDLLHRRYKRSEWASKTPYWYK